MSEEQQYIYKNYDTKEHYLFRSMYFNIPSNEEKYYPTHAYVGFNKNDVNSLSEEEFEKYLLMTYINIYKYDNLL